MDTVGRTKLLRQAYLRVTSSIKYLTLTGLELNAGLTGKMLAANRLSLEWPC